MTATVRVLVSARWTTNNCSPIDARIITGRSNNPMRNDLVRIDDPNSVDATTQIFRGSGRMGEGLRGGRGLGLGRRDPDEDVVERGARDFKMGDARPADQGLEQRLRIAAPPDLLEVPLIVDLLDAVQALEGVDPGVGA